MAELMTRIVLRNDSKANWDASENTILFKGEMGIEFTPAPANDQTSVPKIKVKIGDGITAWKDLPYFGGEDAHTYELEIPKVPYTIEEDGSVITINTQSEAITRAMTKPGSVLYNKDLNSHDMLVVKEAIIAQSTIDAAAEKTPARTIGQQYQYTAYRWDNTKTTTRTFTVTVESGEGSTEVTKNIIGDWVAFDGNYSANNVYFSDDFTFTKAIGTVTIPGSGSTVVAAAGKNLKDFFAGLFAAEENPTRTANASVSWNSNGEPKGTVEVGTEITPTYNAKFNAGSYKYGPATGLTATSWTASIADTGEDSKTTNSGSFNKFTATDGMSAYAKVTVTAAHGDGAIPVTNIGNAYDTNGSKNVRIMAGNKSITSAGYTSYRAWFCGYKNGTSKVNIDEIDSDFIRKLTAKNGSWETSIPTDKMQQMFFAAPAGVVSSVSVVGEPAPQTVTKKTVYVKGANNYVTDDALNGMAYDLFYVSNGNANDGAETFTISWS